MGLELGFGIGIHFGGRPPVAVVRLDAPTGLLLTEDDANGEVDAEWDAVVGATGYSYNYGAGWNDNGTDLFVNDVPVGYDAGIFRVRAYDAVPGRQATAAFDLEEPVDPGEGFYGLAAEDFYVGASSDPFYN